jgi:hypothetical protein
MSNDTERTPLPETDTPVQRIEITTDAGPVDWSSALRELEGADPVQPPVAPPREMAAAARPAFVPRPARKAPVIAEGTPASDELSEVLTSVNSALNQLKRFESAHRHVIAPNIFRVWEDSLRETATVITREYRRLREVDVEAAQEDRAVGEES